MILADQNQPLIVLQLIALNNDGSEKLNVTSVLSRVYSVASGVETDVLAPVAMARVGVTGVWRYEWNPSSLPVGAFMIEHFATDDRGVVTRVVEDLIVRDIARQATLTAVQSVLTLVQSDLEVVRLVETGRWKIEANRMTFYAADDVTPLLVFDLKDDVGAPSSERVFERVPV